MEQFLFLKGNTDLTSSKVLYCKMSPPFFSELHDSNICGNLNYLIYAVKKVVLAETRCNNVCRPMWLYRVNKDFILYLCYQKLSLKWCIGFRERPCCEIGRHGLERLGSNILFDDWQFSWSVLPSFFSYT